VIGEVGFDRSVLDWFVEHRQPWLDTVLQVLTVLGSSVLLIPLVLAVGAWYWRRGGTLRPFVLLAVTFGGSKLLSDAIKWLVGRSRPPSDVWMGDFSGYAFPSGHATQAAAAYLMLAVVLLGGSHVRRHSAAVWAGAIAIVVVVGVTRLYLAAHWLTDVIGGWCFGTAWFLCVLVASKAIDGRSGDPDERDRIGPCAASPSNPTGSPA
jgi:membrane-associated phospholipid phosphatase